MKKFIFAFSILLTFSTSFAATKTCLLEIRDTVSMPNGPEDFPTSNLPALKLRGYSPKIVDYPTSTKGTYFLDSEVTCGNLVFNPWISNCTTTVTLYDADFVYVAQGSSTNRVSVGVYSTDLNSAIANLPTCAKLK